MEKDLVKFMENVTFINKDVSQYEDEKGNHYIIPNGQLVCSCSYMELSKPEYEKALFNSQIERLDYNIIEITRPSSKFERTKKEEDRWIIEDKKIKARQVYLVSNGLKISKSYINKEEALKETVKINQKILRQAELLK